MLGNAVGWLLLRLVTGTVRVVWFALRRPGLTGPLVLFGGVVDAIAHAGWVLSGVVLLLVVVGLVGWRRFHPNTFHKLVSPVWRRFRTWFRNWSRRWVRYGLLWRFWMGRCGLQHKEESGTVVRPHLVKVRCTPSVDRLLLRLPAGMAPDDLKSKRDVLAHAMGAQEARVRRHKPRLVWLDLEMRNPLAKVIPAVPIPDGHDALDVSRLDGLVIGKADDGTPWRLKVRGNHIFVPGATGSGKGSVIWSTLRALAPFIAAGLVQVWAIDPKGGMELEFGRDMFTRYERDDFAAMADMLDEAARAMDGRCRDLRGKVLKFTPSVETPLVLVLVDELATLTALLPDRRLSTQVETALGLLLTKGRAPGFAVMAAVQDVTKEVCRWRDLFPTRIALRLAKAIEVDMALGDGAYDAGAYCDTISDDPTTGAGTAYVLLEGHAEPVRVRAAYVTDEDIVEMNAAYPAGGIALAVPAPQPVPSRVDLAKDSRPARGPETPGPAGRPGNGRKPRKPRQPRTAADVAVEGVES
jgi:S-DNA-T family DNA segregation ATPase FtsK/SpoIIIE